MAIYVGIDKVIPSGIKTVYVGSSKVYEKVDPLLSEYFYVKSNGNTIDIDFVTNSSPALTTNAGLKYSLDKINWTSMSSSRIRIYDGQTCYFKYNGSRTSITHNGYPVTLKMNSIGEIGGNIMSLLDTNFTTANTVTSLQYFLINARGSISKLRLPATNLSPYAYAYFAYNNTYISFANGLTLPATNIPNYCYRYMFSGCTNLNTSTTPIYIKATTIGTDAMEEMFKDCSNANFNQIKLDYTGELNSTTTRNWVSGVTSTGTLYYSGPTTSHGSSAIPTNWTVG